VQGWHSRKPENYVEFILGSTGPSPSISAAVDTLRCKLYINATST